MKQENLRKRAARRAFTGVLVLLAAVLAMGMLTGCGGTNDQGQVKCVDIVKACKEAASEGTLDEWYSYGEELYDDSFDSLYGVQFDMIDDGAVLQTSSGGTADEVSVLHLKKKRGCFDRQAEARGPHHGAQERIQRLQAGRGLQAGQCKGRCAGQLRGADHLR